MQLYILWGKMLPIQPLGGMQRFSAPPNSNAKRRKDMPTAKKTTAKKTTAKKPAAKKTTAKKTTAKKPAAKKK
ncbi:MAG: hypothetical protein WHT06_01945 [Desulfobacterales bacterium]